MLRVKIIHHFMQHVSLSTLYKLNRGFTKGYRQELIDEFNYWKHADFIWDLLDITVTTEFKFNLENNIKHHPRLPKGMDTEQSIKNLIKVKDKCIPFIKALIDNKSEYRKNQKKSLGLELVNED